MKITTIQTTDKRRVLEIIAVTFTALGKFVFMDYLNWKLPFILVAIFAWLTYIWIRSKKEQGLLQYWGFRIDNFKEAFTIVLPFALVAIVSFVIIGVWQNTINLTWHMIPILLFYPFWGVIQQFLVIALVAGNLQDMKSLRLSKPLIILLTAILFAGVHYPNNWLILGTFILALFYGYVYLRVRNVYVLGILHGFLGGLFFYTVVNRDPFMEAFGTFFN